MVIWESNVYDISNYNNLLINDLYRENIRIQMVYI